MYLQNLTVIRICRYLLSYQAGIDTDRAGELELAHYKLFLSVGHDEYWSGAQRKAVEAARDSGTSLAFFSGNEVFWRVRWEDDYRTMVVYKESQEKVKKDPVQTEWTGTWRDGRSINPLGAQPENSLTGTIFTVNAWRHDALEVRHNKTVGCMLLLGVAGAAQFLIAAVLARHKRGAAAARPAADYQARPAGARVGRGYRQWLAARWTCPSQPDQGITYINYCDAC